MQRQESRPLDNDGYQAPKITFGIDMPEDAWNSTNQTRNINSPNHFDDSRNGGFLPTTKAQRFVDKLKEEFSTGFIIPKIFYFFFFCAFGSFFPLMAIYFKNLAFSAGQAGILIGIRPFIEFFSTPIWAKIIDKMGRLKLILMFSLCSLVGFTLALSQIRPVHSGCLAWNLTHYWFLDPVFLDNDDDSTDSFPQTNAVPPHNMMLHLPPDHIIGFSPMKLKQYPVINYHQEDENSNEWLKPPFSAAVYRTDNVQRTFYWLLLVVILSEFFASPAIPLADAAVIASLPPGEVNRHARQRMFGSLGWGAAMFCVGFVLDHSAMIGWHPCEVKDQHERNYTYCFAAFSSFMIMATLSASRMKLNNLPKQIFGFGSVRQALPAMLNPSQPIDTKYVSSSSRLAEEYPDEGMLDAPIISTSGNLDEYREEDNNPMRSDYAVLITVFKTYGNLKFFAMLYTGWFFGFGTALIFSYQFWHLQDLGGKASVFGVASILNHTAEICSFFVTGKLIRKIGYYNALYLALFLKGIRFLTLASISNPWWVLVFAVLQGFTHALEWVAICSYFSLLTASTQGLQPGAQAILQIAQHGLGRACGSIMGGFFMDAYGSTVLFLVYGISSLVHCVLLYGFLWFYKRYYEHGGTSVDSDQPMQLLEGGPNWLNPHGVPGTSVSRSPSPSPLHPLNQSRSAADIRSSGSPTQLTTAASYGAMH